MHARSQRSVSERRTDRGGGAGWFVRRKSAESFTTGSARTGAYLSRLSVRRGGATGFIRPDMPLAMRHHQIRVLTVTMSDTRKRSNDESGRALVDELVQGGVKHVRHVILKEEPRFLQELVRSASTDNAADAFVI